MNSLTETDFQSKPLLFLDLARRWAAGDAEPTEEQELWLKRAPRPIVVFPSEARPALWEILLSPQRGRALAWLDRMGILEEILPVWGGEFLRQALRLQAVEEIHLEHWATGLSDDAYDWLCVYQDQRIESGLNGWAITALATLLLTGDEPLEDHLPRVARDLRALNAGAGERDRVEDAVREYPELFQAVVEDQLPSRSFGPTTIVATLATLFVYPNVTDELRTRARRIGDQLLLRFAAPGAVLRPPHTNG
ncbi:MAG: hypothetical protein PHI18_03755 [bacterium]|nr:hypothetical protein [bacterium]